MTRTCSKFIPLISVLALFGPQAASASTGDDGLRLSPFSSSKVLSHPADVVGSSSPSIATDAASVERSIEITISGAAPARLVSDLDMSRQYLEVHLSDQEPSGSTAALRVSVGEEQAKEFDELRSIWDHSLKLTHILYTSSEDSKSWAFATYDSENRLYMSLSNGVEEYRIFPTTSGVPAAFRGRGRIDELKGADGKSSLAERRHIQVVQLSMRRVERHRSIRGTNVLSYASGGDLGKLNNEKSLPSYIKDMSDLLGSHRGVDVRGVGRKLIGERFHYFATQYLSDIESFDSRIRVVTDEKTGRVELVQGAIEDPDSLISGEYFESSDQVLKAMISHLSGLPGLRGVDFSVIEAPKQVWKVEDSGPTLFWTGQVGVVGSPLDVYSFLANTVTGEIVHFSNFQTSVRSATCNANGATITSCNGQYASQYPWVTYMDQDQDPRCNDSNPNVPSSWCTLSEYTTPRDTADYIEHYGEQELDAHCCDVSDGFIYVIVNRPLPSEGGLATGAGYDPVSKNIYVSDAVAARSADLIFLESMHALINTVAEDSTGASPLQSAYGTDDVAAAIMEGLAETGLATWKGSWDDLYDDWVGSGVTDLTVSKSFADHDDSGDANGPQNENGEIVGHLFYKIASLPGGSNASAKKIALRSIEHLDKALDGVSASWSYEDLRLAMRAAAVDGAPAAGYAATCPCYPRA